MKSLLIVTGPPGAGKSTVAKRLAARRSPSVLVDGDQFFGFLAEGAIQPWLPQAEAQNTIVTESAASATARFAVDYDTTYDGVVGPWFLPAFAAATGRRALDYVIVLPPVDVCVDRVATRTGHGFTDPEATRSMHAEFSNAAVEPRHVLETGTTDVQQVVESIRSAQSAGLLRYDIGG